MELCPSVVYKTIYVSTSKCLIVVAEICIGNTSRYGCIDPVIQTEPITDGMIDESKHTVLVYIRKSETGVFWKDDWFTVHAIVSDVINFQ
jgi:hypothetical protein